MTPEQIEIARALVAAEWWEWRAGMLTHTTAPGGLPSCPAGTPVRVHSDDEMMDLQAEGMIGCDCSEICDGQKTYIEDGRYVYKPCINPTLPPAIPDLTDAATGGVLLAMLMPRTIRPPRPGLPAWAVVAATTDGGAVTCHGTTLAEACARALLAVRS